MTLADDFTEFWAHYPRKVGKLAAQQQYEKARKRGVTQQQLLDGIARYLRYKPAYADWAHPKTWLNQGRWEDDYDEPVLTPRAEGEDWFAECQRLHAGLCNGRAGHATQLLIDKHREADGREPHPHRKAGLEKERQGVS